MTYISFRIKKVPTQAYSIWSLWSQSLKVFQTYSIDSRLADGWIARKLSLYKVSSEEKSWAESIKSCLNMGADLVIVNDKDEQVREGQVVIRISYFLNVLFIVLIIIAGN